MKLIAWLIEAIGWIKIVASPFFVGVFLGGFVYLYWQQTAGLIAGALMALAGLVTGIIWATSIWRKQGTMHFLSKVNASPDLDKLVRTTDKK